MIVDRIEHGSHYAALHAGLAQAFAFLQTVLEKGAVLGRHILVPERLWVIVERGAGRGSQAPLEAHRRFIDIQLVLEGNERIGWRPLDDCRSPRAAYDGDRDIVFFNDASSMWLDLSPGQFAIFFPRDAHAPLTGRGEVLKAIAKVAVDCP